MMVRGCLNVVTSPPYKRLLIIGLLVLAFSFILNGLTSNTNFSVDGADMADNYMTIEGYVVSKRIGTIWLANEPVNIWERLIGYLAGYGAGSIVVSKHKDAESGDLFNNVKINQKVRVYGDRLKESFPGKISAYNIEIINDS